MHTHINKKTLYDGLVNGINTDPIKPYLKSITTQYKHGIIYDTVLFDRERCVSVISKNLLKFVQQWGKLKIVPGELTLVINHDTHTNSISIENQLFEITYECNSKKIFKPYRRLEKMVKSARTLTGRPDSKYDIRNIDDTSLMIALFLTDPIEQLKILEPYSTNRISKCLDSARFKHMYKLIHPDTVFTKTHT